MALRKGTITEGGNKITWTQTDKGISYSDGKTAIPSPDNMDAKIAYKTATSVVVPPVVIPPVVDTKWVSYTPDELSTKVGLKDVNVRIKASTKPYTGQYTLTDFERVTIDLNASEGVVFSTWNMEAFVLKGITNDLHFINGNVTKTNRPFVKYDYLGSKQLSGITFDKMVLDNTGSLFDSQGGYKDSVEQLALGIINNFKVTNTTIKNSPNQGTFVVVKGEDWLFENVTVDNVAVTSGQHAHILVLMGNGIIRNSIVTNHRGSFNRVTAYNLTTANKKSVFTNNIVDSSTRYSAFEVFYLPDEVYKKAGLFYPSSVLIYNNTIGRLGWTDKIWENVGVDIYDSRGAVEFYNNLCYNLYSNNNNANPSLINYASRDAKDPLVKSYGNVYKATWQEAVENLNSFKSKFNGVGASL